MGHGLCLLALAVSLAPSTWSAVAAYFTPAPFQPAVPYGFGPEQPGAGHYGSYVTGLSQRWDGPLFASHAMS